MNKRKGAKVQVSIGTYMYSNGFVKPVSIGSMYSGGFILFFQVIELNIGTPT